MNGRIHVGTYLIGEGRRELARLLACREAPRFRVLQWVYRHHAAVYFLGLGVFSAVFIFLIVWLGLRGQALWIRLLIALPFADSRQPAGDRGGQLPGHAATCRPAPLPKMDFEDLGHSRRLPDPGGRADDAGGRGDDPGRGGEAGDPLPGQQGRRICSSASSRTTPMRIRRIGRTTSGCSRPRSSASKISIDRYGGERFFLFHRERTWSESEQKFIGWERKRGQAGRTQSPDRRHAAGRCRSPGLRRRPGSSGGCAVRHHPGQRHPAAASARPAG